ncbi:MAG TPA: OmpA family protein [Ignavibacteriales bacterium]|nr:OmpA family protein [Ignavibacteriales bacterium]
MNLKSTVLFLAILFASGYAQQASENNLFDYNRGVRVVDFSSNYEDRWDVQNILENTPMPTYGDWPAWCTAQNAPFPHFVTVDLSRTEWIDILIFNNKIPDESGGWKGISAKDIDVYISGRSKDEGFVKAASFRLENNVSHQVVKITPVEARWVKFVVNSNYGHPEYTELGQLGGFDDKKREADIKAEIDRNGFIDLYGLYFDFGSDNLKAESKPSIDNILKYLKQNPGIKILIEGHTDNVGSDAANNRLSENRASSVKNELVKNGIDEARLSVKGFGSKRPVGDNNSVTGRAQNRRVTIRKI